jgi:DNA-binding response OmpR family regulator
VDAVAAAPAWSGLKVCKQEKVEEQSRLLRDRVLRHSFLVEAFVAGELICILEHDQLTLHLLAQELEDADFATLRLSEAAGSLPVMKENRPDLLVLDMGPPLDETGWTLLEGIRSDGGLGKMPVIVCTSDTRAIEKRSALLKGTPESSVLGKPFTPEALLAMIRAMLAARPGE